jgi:electron transfer flavoprotein alpha/beta subunit
MTRRVAVILGTAESGGSLPLSDRAAVGLAARGLTGTFDAYSFRGDAAALRYAVAAGAAEARCASDPRQVEFDVALVGGGGCGAWGDLLPATLAEQRGAALVLDVLDSEFVGDDLRVVRDLGRGAREILRVRGPAVLVMSEDAPRRMYVSRYRRQKATAEAAAPRETSPATSWETARRRTRTVDLARKTGGKATDRFNALVGASEAATSASEHIVQADAETCAKHLLRYLAHHGFITTRVDDAPGVGVKVAPVGGEAHVVRHAVTDRRQRGPRPVSGRAPAVHRRPRAVGVGSMSLGKLARKPRRVGEAVPLRVRGPFPVKNPGASEDLSRRA